MTEQTQGQPVHWLRHDHPATGKAVVLEIVQRHVDIIKVVFGIVHPDLAVGVQLDRFGVVADQAAADVDFLALRSCLRSRS